MNLDINNNEEEMAMCPNCNTEWPLDEEGITNDCTGEAVCEFCSEFCKKCDNLYAEDKLDEDGLCNKCARS